MTLAQTILKYSGVAATMQSGALSMAISEAAFFELRPELKDVALNAASIGGLGLSPSESVAFAAFVDTYTAENAGLVSFFRLYGAEEGALAGTTAAPDAGLLPVMTPENVENWVRTGFEIQAQDESLGKVFDGRDTGVDETVRRMQGILLFGSDESTRALARQKYGPIIAAFVGNALGTASPKTEWAQTILAAWVAHVRIRFPEIGLKKLRELLK